MARKTPIIATRLYGNGKKIESAKLIARDIAIHTIWVRKKFFVSESTTEPWLSVLK
ncbi:MAG TPA: hypothetical protein VGQ03_09765 [Nitrososphaera sp.]|jgi:hypothetical protein|nr:hypothetical protein [Nitrososphaera sp.]